MSSRGQSFSIALCGFSTTYSPFSAIRGDWTETLKGLSRKQWVKGSYGVYVCVSKQSVFVCVCVCVLTRNTYKKKGHSRRVHGHTRKKKSASHPWSDAQLFHAKLESESDWNTPRLWEKCEDVILSAARQPTCIALHGFHLQSASFQYEDAGGMKQWHLAACCRTFGTRIHLFNLNNLEKKCCFLCYVYTFVTWLWAIQATFILLL